MITYKNYKISSDEYNYILFRKKGKKQWYTLGYYSTLTQAIESIRSQEIRKILKETFIDLDNPETAKSQKTEFLSKLEKLNNEFKEALKCLN